MNNIDSYDGKPPFTMIPPELQDLLLAEGQKLSHGNDTALGTGIISILGTARSAKTTLAYTLIDWVIHYTRRKIYLSNFPQVIIDEGIPEHWRGRVETKPIEDMWRVNKNTNAVWLHDDAAVNSNSRDSLTRKAKLTSRLAGIISHLGGGQTMIYTTQSLAGVDKTLFRFCETCTIVRHLNSAGLKGERDEWREDVDNALYLLKQAHLSNGSNSKRLRDYYVTISSNEKNPYRIVPYLKPKWLFSMDPIKKDMLSRPFRYMPLDELEIMILQHDTTPERKKIKRTVKE